ncbi:hypothetical protein DY052_07680 [Apilactobacillus timberlakei]|uniref:hypothetical protein n=1 Tax=Apilactobacillus timberlakei TaxID=2008380 RepID=UPI0011288333|nr:hypothetical protein [Apilactobacillus timberlakei]TPR13734.1 hypothetical protein DY052_07680 [Apilactobacillus timberlakei]
MPAKRDVLALKTDNSQNEADTDEFIQAYNQMSEPDRQYAEQLLKIASSDPKAFTYAAMQYNGYQKEHNLWKKRPLEQLKKDEQISPKLYQSLHPKEANSTPSIDDAHLSRVERKQDEANRAFVNKKQEQAKLRILPNYNSKPEQSYGFLGNFVYRAMYATSYRAVRTGMSFTDAFRNAKRDAKDNNQLNPDSEQLKNDTKKFAEQNKTLKQATNKDLKINDTMVGYLGFKNLLRPELTNNPMINEMNKHLQPTVPHYLQMRKSSGQMLDEIDKYKHDPQSYLKSLDIRQNNKFTNDKQETITFAIAQGNVQNGKLLSRSELKQSADNEPDKTYTISFSDGLAKEYKNLKSLSNDLDSNSPKDIHKGIEEDKNKQERDKEFINKRSHTENINNLDENRSLFDDIVNQKEQKKKRNSRHIKL